MLQILEGVTSSRRGIFCSYAVSPACQSVVGYSFKFDHGSMRSLAALFFKPDAEGVRGGPESSREDSLSSSEIMPCMCWCSNKL
jgi:hypothetical protein